MFQAGASDDDGGGDSFEELDYHAGGEQGSSKPRFVLGDRGSSSSSRSRRQSSGHAAMAGQQGFGDAKADDLSQQRHQQPQQQQQQQQQQQPQPQSRRQSARSSNSSTGRIRNARSEDRSSVHEAQIQRIGRRRRSHQSGGLDVKSGSGSTTSSPRTQAASQAEASRRASQQLKREAQVGGEDGNHDKPADDVEGDEDEYDVDDPRFAHLGLHRPQSHASSADRAMGALSDAISEDGLMSFVREEDIVYTHEPNVKVIGRYLFGDRLGDGSYSKVKEALDIITLQRYAVKIMKNRRIRKFMYGQENVRREIQILRRLHHPNVTRLHDVLYNHAKEKIYMVLEYCHSNLQDMLRSAPKQRFPLWQTQHYLVQLLDAVAYIHSQGIIHRDIKPSNVLVKSGGRVKLSDFGVADVLDPFQSASTCNRSSGTHVFQSPELAAGATSFDGVKVDVWAVGVTLWNMVTGHYPFFDDNVIDLFTSISNCDYTIPEQLPAPLRDLIGCALARDPDERATVWALQEHPWCRCRLPRDDDAVELVARASTVLPYLKEMYEDTINSDGETDSTGFVSPDMIAVSRRSSLAQSSPMMRSRSRSRASNVSPRSSSPHSERSGGDRPSRGSHGPLRRLWNTLFGGERSSSRDRSGRRSKPGSMTHLAVPAISEEQEPEEDVPARSASSENLQESRHNSERSTADEPHERGRSYSSTITRHPQPFI